MYTSTAKITFAGAGISAMAASSTNIAWNLRHLGIQTIGPDKMNQLRHVLFLRDMPTILAHMARHAAIMKPKFDAVQSVLTRELGGKGIARWTNPGGGYFVSLDTMDGCATEVIRRAARHEGVVLAIQGADGRTAYSRSKRGRRKDEERRLEVQRAMRDFCAAQHIWYENSETPAWATDPELARNRVGDGLHANARWHAHSAELIVGTIRNALNDAGHAEGRGGDAVADPVL